MAASGGGINDSFGTLDTSFPRFDSSMDDGRDSAPLYSPTPRNQSAGPAASPTGIEKPASDSAIQNAISKVLPDFDESAADAIYKITLSAMDRISSPVLFEAGTTHDEIFVPHTFILLEDSVEGGVMLIVPEEAHLSAAARPDADATASEKQCFSAKMIDIFGDESELPIPTVVLVADSAVASIRSELSALLTNTKGSISGNLLPVKYCFTHRGLSIGIQQKHRPLCEAQLRDLPNRTRLKAAIDLSHAVASLFRKGSYHGDLRLENCAMYTNFHGTESFGLFDFGELRSFDRAQGRRIGHLAEVPPEVMLAKMIIKLKRPDLFFFNPKMGDRIERMKNNKVERLKDLIGDEACASLVSRIDDFASNYQFSKIEEIVSIEGPMSDEAEQAIRVRYGTEQEIYAFHSILYPILKPYIETDPELRDLISSMQNPDPAARPTIETILGALQRRTDVRAKFEIFAEKVTGSFEEVFAELAFNVDRLRALKPRVSNVREALSAKRRDRA